MNQADGRRAGGEPQGGRAAPSHGAAVAGIRAAGRAYLDRLVACDPGLNRLMTAGRVLAGVGATIAVEYAFMQATHAMWTSAAAQQRSITILAMLIGGIVAMMSSLAVMDATPASQAVTLVLLPLPMLATMALSIELSTHHAVGLLGLVVVLGIGTYLRKFTPQLGPRVFVYGMLLFMGYFFGFLAGSEIPVHDLGWIAAILWTAVAVNLALRLLADVTIERKTVSRTERAFESRARRVVGAAARLLSADTARTRHHASRRLIRRLRRLNEAALMIDGQLITQAVTPPPPAAWGLHRKVFELELAVQTIGRACRAVAGSLPDRLRGELQSILIALRLGNDELAESLARALRDSFPRLDGDGLEGRRAAWVQALTGAVIDTSAALAHRLRDDHQGASAELEAPFQSPVKLTGGNLAGSAQVSAAAVAPDRRGRLVRRLRLDAPAQTAIRVTIAVGAACAAGSLLSERRFYWAVIAVFIAFMGANTAGEQIIKAGNRVAGTVVGILVGSLLATAVGPGAWSLAIILPALAIGVYFQRVSYSLMVIGITIMVAQLYVVLGEYSSSLLTLRLEETAIGAAIGMLAALTVFPVSTSGATRFALGGCLDALAELLDHLRDPPDDRQWGGHLADQRALDDAVQQLLATARPLAFDPFLARRDIERTLGVLETAAYYARAVVARASRDPEAIQPFHRALAGQAASAKGLARGVRDGADHARYRSLESRWHAIDSELAARNTAERDPRRQVLRALIRLDEALVALAREVKVAVRPVDGDAFADAATRELVGGA